MKSICRVGDSGSGYCDLHEHRIPITVTLTSGEIDIETEGLPTATVGSTGIASCGHPTVALTGSVNYTVNGKGVHRVGDQGTTGSGVYTMTTGSLTVDSTE